MKPRTVAVVITDGDTLPRHFWHSWKPGQLIELEMIMPSSPRNLKQLYQFSDGYVFQYLRREDFEVLGAL